MDTCEQTNHINKQNRRLITAKTLFGVSMIVIVLTILSIWLTGLSMYRTLFDNALLSTSILSVAFFLFLNIGLYKGVKLKNDMGNFSQRIKAPNISQITNLASSGDFMMVGDGISGIIMSILLWMVATIVVVLLFWLFGTIVWTSIILFMGMLYWIFFRALRLVFKKSNQCKGQLVKSMCYALGYTLLYTSWILTLIFITNYWI